MILNSRLFSVFQLARTELSEVCHTGPSMPNWDHGIQHAGFLYSFNEVRQIVCFGKTSGQFLQNPDLNVVLTLHWVTHWLGADIFCLEHGTIGSGLESHVRPSSPCPSMPVCQDEGPGT